MTVVPVDTPLRYIRPNVLCILFMCISLSQVGVAVYDVNLICETDIVATRTPYPIGAEQQPHPCDGIIRNVCNHIM